MSRGALSMVPRACKGGVAMGLGDARRWQVPRARAAGSCGQGAGCEVQCCGGAGADGMPHMGCRATSRDFAHNTWETCGRP
jgi:hypothetical protein